MDLFCVVVIVDIPGMGQFAKVKKILQFSTCKIAPKEAKILMLHSRNQPSTICACIEFLDIVFQRFSQILLMCETLY